MLNKHSKIYGNKLLKMPPQSEHIFQMFKSKTEKGTTTKIKMSDVAPGKTILIQCKKIF